ncbi:hypothetical protein [Wocania ichthyoenteri]|uniref:hypothetical protein n=1 Tax=Wocania ichthyoenteri TaxID=1230531 RepID=UPI00053D230A|nr:hypothetical protein [Wocania ichthyoenteri]
MIDGIKLLCISTTPKDWLHNPLLQFQSKLNENTGEISDVKYAFYKGLFFKIVPSTVSNHFHLIIRGSLAKYYNNGKHNAFDFDMNMLEETINELQNTFKVKPDKAILQNFEFGANINPNKPIKTIIRGIRAWQNNCFSSLKTEEIFDGKQLKRQEYIYKVYDKGIVSPDTPENLLRIELAVKSTKLAKKHNIKVLADVLNPDNLNSIKPLLIDVWGDMIFYDKGAKLREMTPQQRQKWLFYLDASNWVIFSRAQRFKAKKIFQELKSEFCTSTTQEETLKLLVQKLETLSANNHPKNGNALRNFSEYKSERFTDLDKGVNRYLFDEVKKNKKNAPIKRRKCVMCKTNITKKKRGAKYCSKSCNNRSNYIARKKKLKKMRRR